jgi:type I restriction enzyme S subunit
VGDFQDNTRIDGVSGLSVISLNAMPPTDYLLRDGDIVFVRSNGNKKLVGRSAVVNPGAEPTTFSGFCIRLRLSDNAVTVDYLSHVLRHSSIKAQMFRDVRGANITNLNQKILSGLDVPIPPFDLQNRFAEFVGQVDKSKFEVQEGLKKLELQYNALMQQYFG